MGTAPRDNSGVELLALRSVTLPRPERKAEDSPLARLGGGGDGKHGSPVLEGVDLVVRSGSRMGIVGRNGSGKSTLLAALHGRVTPTAGRLVRAPGVRTALLEQGPPSEALTVESVLTDLVGASRATEAELAAASAALSAGDEGAEERLDDVLRALSSASSVVARAWEVLSALGFERDGATEPHAVSSAAGQRRLALAAALLAEADVLLLDEPTNRLDLGARRWLGSYLSGRAGAVVVVSHDRAFLDDLTTETAFLSGGRSELEAAPFGRASRRREARAGASARTAARLRRESERMERVAAELARHGRRSRARERSASKLADAANALEPGGPSRRRDVRARDPGPARRQWSLHVLAEEPDPAAPFTDVALTGGDTVALLGPDGSGKTEVLLALAGLLPPGGTRFETRLTPGARCILLDADSRGLAPGVPLLEQLEAPLGSDRARTVLARAGVGYPAWGAAPEQVSGGERAKAGLALAFALEPDLLLLDEPESDLDMEGIELLEADLAALAAAGGGYVLVTHDARLAERTCRRAWSSVDGRLMAFPSVRAFLRGEAPQPVETYSAAGQEVAERPTVSVGPTGREAVRGPLTSRQVLHPDAVTGPEAGGSRLEVLEDARSALLEELADPTALSRREEERVRARLRELEGEILSEIDLSLPPPGPRYRFRERGLRLVADLSPDAEGWAVGTAWPPSPPYASLKVVAGVGHVVLVEPPDACAVPELAAALLDAATELGFVVAGVGAVQTYLERPALGTLLAPSDGSHWRYLDEEGFLLARLGRAGSRPPGSTPLEPPPLLPDREPKR